MVLPDKIVATMPGGISSLAIGFMSPQVITEHSDVYKFIKESCAASSSLLSGQRVVRPSERDSGCIAHC